MPYNLPSYETDRFSFGPGILYIGVAGTTPLEDVGAVRSGGSLGLAREVLEVPQGSPKQIVKRWATAETATLSLTGIEWNLQNLSRFLGVDYEVGPPTVLPFGGDIEIEEVALRFVHQTPAGGTVEVWMWKAQGSGSIEITFGDEVHEFPYVFNATDSSTDWAGDALGSKEHLCKVLFYREP